MLFACYKFNHTQCLLKYVFECSSYHLSDAYISDVWHYAQSTYQPQVSHVYTLTVKCSSEAF